ncbi:S-layer homology domain-containing protein [Clostridium aminobutyricum]|uniref:S-layer homology domain-containing protein n=1 Tax=Clostridium aminobutyricum TaxID=33953 RepID=A0A939IJ01_CLOAM|nr:S-layer homology domain-containing protein [Clostridium aminobutyricum]MBN7773098.1 S-layer homology domain-containing protein [Clostridium aminobutyricum]
MMKILCRKVTGIRLIGILFIMVITAMPAFAETAYSDVPADSWAVQSIKDAGTYGLMQGQAQDSFGYGKTITKAEFATILCNMLKWQAVNPEQASFSDVSKDQWYYSYVETALANNAMDKTGSFLPDSPITREEMAVMFVKALGLSDAAKTAESSAVPFTDVTTNKGYISIAYDIGMINGISDNSFAPGNTAKREEAAAMLTRVYAKYYGKTDFLHGFYAISSYSQKDLTSQMDAVTFGWSAMENDDKGVWLNTGSDGGNQFKIPSGYEDILSYVSGNGTKAHLGVYMDTSAGVKELLLSADKRKVAVDAIMAELTKTYDAVGKNPYSGVTIDFEGLKGSDVKQGFNAFLTELSTQLKAQNKTLYVTVQPALSTGAYYDGFDYRTIGQLADKVILMAHDYNPTSLEGYTGTEWYKNTAVTPIGSVYYSLKAITDSTTGVADKNKIVLAVSFATVGWELSDDGKLLSVSPLHADTEAVYKWMNTAGAEKGFSTVYRNPYLKYTTPEGRNVFLWYENEQSMFEKAALARMFGINEISIWRLGLIPDYSGYNAIDSLK